MAKPLSPYSEYQAAMTDKAIYENLGELARGQYDLANVKAKKKYFNMLAQGEDPQSIVYEDLYNEAFEEVQTKFMEPGIQTGYGTFEELVAKPGLTSFIPTARPMNVPVAPGDEEPGLMEALGFQQRVSPKQKQIFPEASLDVEAIEKSLIENEESPMVPTEAKATAKAYEEAVRVMKEKNPEYRLDQIAATVSDEIQKIAEVDVVDLPMDTSGVIFKGGAKDPLIQAFQQQVTPGQIPNYSTTQQRFLKSYLQSADEAYVRDNYDDIAQESTEYKTIKTSKGNIQLPTDVIDYIRNNDERLVPPVYNAEIDALVREGGQTVRRQLLVKPEKKRADIEAVATIRSRAQTGSDAWFLDPQKKSMVLSDPEAFVEQGFFTDESLVGGTRETIGSWTLRAALSPLNAVAGTVMEIATTEELSEAKRRQREKDTALYADNPMLANIALNKGFTGEAIDASNALGLEGWQKYATIGGGFATDILDPTFAIATGAIKGAKAANTVRKAQKAFAVAPDISKTKVFSAAVLNEVANDFNILAPFAKKGLEKVEDVGDIRMLMSGELNKQVKVLENAAQTDDVSAFLQRSIDDGLGQHPLTQKILDEANVKPWEEVVSNSKKVARGSIDNPNVSKILDNHLEVNRFLDEIAEQGGDIKAAREVLTEAEEIANIKPIAEYLAKSGRQADQFLFDDEIEAVRKSLRTSTARALLFEIAPEATSLKNVVAVTKNTYAHPERVSQILEEALKTDTGQFLLDFGETARVKISTGPTKMGQGLFPESKGLVAPKVENVYVVTDANKNRLQGIVDSMPSLGLERKTQILKEIDNGELTFDSYRLLVDSNVDNVAKAMPEGITMSDVERLRKTVVEGDVVVAKGELLPQAKALLDPSEARMGEMVSGLASKVYKKLFERPEPKWVQSATLQQRKVANGIKQRTSALDSALRREVRGLTSGRFPTYRGSGNPELKALYGIGPDEVITRKQALGYAIVGPKAKPDDFMAMLAQEEQVMVASTWALNRLFFKLDYVENIQDSFFGVNQLFKTSLTNEKGETLVQALTLQFAKDVMANPGDYTRLFTKLVEDYGTILDDSSNLIKGVTPGTIRKPTPNLLKELDAELLIGQYYFSKSAAIVEEEILKFLDDSEFTTAFTYGNILPKEPLLNVTEDVFENLLREATVAVQRGNYKPGDVKFDLFIAMMKNKETKTNPLLIQTIGRDPLDAVRGLPDGVPTDLYKIEMNQNPELWNMYHEMSPVLDRMLDDGRTIINRNGIGTGINTSLDESIRQIDALFDDDNFDIARAIFGDKLYDQLRKDLFEGRTGLITNQMDRVIRAELNSKFGLDAVKRMMNFIASFRYTVLLGVRPRFHGPNLATANAITYTTVGKLATAGGNPFPIDGYNVAFNALSPVSKKYYDIAVTTPSGKKYTYGEIGDLIYESGIRSEHDFVNSVISDKNIVSFIEPKKLNALRRSSGRLGEFTTQEDVMFRAQIMINALKEGRSQEDAVNLARISLFDYNNLSQAEAQWAANYFMFYSFSRQNYGTMVKSLTDPRLFKRYIDILKFKRGTEMLLSEMQGRDYYDLQFIPDYIKNRAVLNITEGQSYDYYLTAPPIPAVDGLIFLSNMLQGEVAEMFRKQMTPELKLMFGIEDPFKQGNNIAPEFIKVFSNFTDDPYEMAKYIQIATGGKVNPVQAPPEKGGIQIGGGSYRFDLSPSQQKSWMDFLKTIVWEGIDLTSIKTASRDYVKIFSPEGTAYDHQGPLGRGTSSIGFSTPMKGQKLETAELGTVRTRRYALQDELRKTQRDIKKAKDEMIRKSLEEEE